MTRGEGPSETLCSGTPPPLAARPFRTHREEDLQQRCRPSSKLEALNCQRRHFKSARFKDLAFGLVQLSVQQCSSSFWLQPSAQPRARISRLKLLLGQSRAAVKNSLFPPAVQALNLCSEPFQTSPTNNQAPNITSKTSVWSTKIVFKMTPRLSQLLRWHFGVID